MYQARAGHSPGGHTYKYINTFHPLPWQEAPWKDFTSPIVLYTGSSGGGKSLLSAERCHAFCLKYPGATVLVLRKTKDSLRNSTILLMERTVIGKDPRVQHRPTSSRFEYTNGSILAYMGMNDEDARERIRSFGQEGGIDMVWMEEATEFDEEDFNEVLARMRGKAASWRQLMLSCNPDGPAHWIRVRLILGGEATVYYSSAVDNPHNPGSYIESLNKLTGVQKQRLVLGKWVMGSGAIFDTWKDDYGRGLITGNVTEEADYEKDTGSVVWAIDDGYSGKMDKATGIYTGKSHPRAILLCQIRPTGQIAVFDESYAIETLAPEQIADVLRSCLSQGWARPEWVVRDRAAASLEGALKAAGIRRVKYNTVSVDESTKEMRQWLAADQNGFRRVIVHPRCKKLRYEMAQYSMDKHGKIIKEHDNGPDALRYLVYDEAYGISRTVDIATWSMVAGV